MPTRSNGPPENMVQFDGGDIESEGTRFRLNTDSFDNGMEPIPSLDIEFNPEAGRKTPGSSSHLRSPLPSQSSSSAAVSSAPEHNVIRSITTMEYLWRRHVRSQTSNRTVQAMLDRILVVLLFLASWVEQPLSFVLGQKPRDSKNGEYPTADHSKLPIIKGTAKTGLGVVAYTISQAKQPKKSPILCFHSHARSSDEYTELQPLLAAMGRRVVALDMPGYGWSQNPRRSCSINDIADAFVQVADSLLIDRFVCLANYQGTALGIAIAARYPDRVRSCINVNLLYNSLTLQTNGNDQNSNLVSSRPLAFKDDGSHLIDLHSKYKSLDPDLNLRCIRSELQFITNQRIQHADGITIEDHSRFDLESAARRLQCPTLCVSGEAFLGSMDARGLGGTQRFDTACRQLPHCEVNSLTGPRSTIHMMNLAPKELASLLAGFLEKHSL